MITLDHETHTYLKDGQPLDLPSVTEIIAPLGRDYAGISPYYAERGRAIHAGCALLNEGMLDWDSVDPEIEGYLRAYERFLKESNYVPSRWEQPLESQRWGFTGTYDLICGNTLLDIKTSKSVDLVVELQLGGQEILIAENKVASVEERGYLQLIAAGEWKVKLVGIHVEGFLGALAVYRWKQGHTRAKKICLSAGNKKTASE